jgi:predicted transcriptional regulator
MSLSPVKKEILETLSRNDKAVKATEVAKESGKDFKPVMMHILGLVKMGYVSTPEKGFYAITQKGKEALLMPDMNKEKAEAILSYAPHDKAFHFYADVGNPLSIHAHNLRDFAIKIEKAPVESVQFHMNRGDFEAWILGLGDEDLSKKVAALKEKNVVGEDLRSQLHELVEQRYVELAKLTGQPICLE